MKTINNKNTISKSKKLFLLLLITFTLSCCNKDDETPSNPIDLLPPATQTGANKIGCLLDGQPFLPGNQPNATNCFYQLVNGEYYFFVRCQNRDSQNNLISIDIATKKLSISQNMAYPLNEYIDGKASGFYLYNLNESYTSQIYTGELKITRLDQVNQVVSGTFWFDVQDTNGVVHEIREGRFDVQYTN